MVWLGVFLFYLGFSLFYGFFFFFFFSFFFALSVRFVSLRFSSFWCIYTLTLLPALLIPYTHTLGREACTIWYGQPSLAPTRRRRTKLSTLIPYRYQTRHQQERVSARYPRATLPTWRQTYRPLGLRSGDWFLQVIHRHCELKSSCFTSFLFSFFLM